MSGHILAIDQGTTSTRALIFGPARQIVAAAQQEFAQHYPADGWVEQDPEDIWRTTLTTARDALGKAGLAAADIAGIGITNQRETVVLWDRASGRPVHRAIVWQDRRTAANCAALRAQGHEPLVQERTGLLLDPYFSATKLAWLLDTIPGARARAERGELAFGTIDSFLLWRLTEGREHKTDVTNASRTLLFDIHRRRWCPEMLDLFRVPAAVLPQVCENTGDLGATGLLGGRIKICGMVGDQQSALIGQSCRLPGQAKITYGTGGFMLLNTGPAPVQSRNRLLTTIASSIDGTVAYALEGSLFVAGAAVKWLRDGLGIITDPGETQQHAQALPDNGGVYMVPAFVGLGAPHWDAAARALLTGLTLGTGVPHIARAALESVAFQTADLVAAMAADGAGRPAVLRVDGGMAANDWLCQFLADILDLAVDRPASHEATALGAAMLAAHASGAWADAFATPADERVMHFSPRMDPLQRVRLLGEWQTAVRRALMT
ncbi:MAG: glycerol kinase GlpK [Pseudomonadota bacterium]